MNIEWLKIKVRYIKAKYIAFTRREDIIIKKPKQAFVMLAANYNNLGDIAITKAQQDFLKACLPKDYEVIVMPYDKTYNVYFSMKKVVNKDTIITLIGGGNSGTLYEFIEGPRRFILKNFAKCKIISFPQSVYYGASKKEKIYADEFKRLCKKCQNITLIAREQIAYDAYKGMLDNNIKVLLTPDIVFSMNKIGKNNNRDGVSFIFRNDKEKAINMDLQEALTSICAKQFGNISFNDTCDVEITGNGYEELKELILEIASKELIITDRLHGMILSYITHTPCIVLDNNNHKIASTFETWLTKQNLISMIKDISSIYIEIEKVSDGESKDLSSKFNPLIKALLS